MYVAAQLIVVVVIAVIVARTLFGNQPRRRLLSLGVTLSVLRVGALWFLQYHAWNRTESLGYLPLVFLLMPEGFAAERLFALGPDARVMSIVCFSLLLVGGSFLLASAVEFVERRVRRWVSAEPAG